MVIYRTMVMNLPPYPIHAPEDPARPDRHIQHRIAGLILTPLSANDIKDLTKFMIAVIIKFEPILPGTLENSLLSLPVAPTLDKAFHGRGR